MRKRMLMASLALSCSGIAFAIGHASDGRDLRQHVTDDMTSGHLGHASDGSGISGAGSGHATNDTVMGDDSGRGHVTDSGGLGASRFRAAARDHVPLVDNPDIVSPS